MNHTTTIDPADVHSAHRRSLLPAAATSVARTISTWRQRSLQRATLSELDEFGLRDIGRSRSEVAAECRKWFWQN